MAQLSRTLAASQAQLQRVQSIPKVGSWVYEIAVGQLQLADRLRRCVREIDQVSAAKKPTEAAGSGGQTSRSKFFMRGKWLRHV